MPLILKALLLALLLAAVLSQTADDDEVNASYPGYPHTFYSGSCKDTQVFSKSTSEILPKTFTTCSSPP